MLVCDNLGNLNFYNFPAPRQGTLWGGVIQRSR